MTEARTVDVSIVMPCLNEELTLPFAVAMAAKACEKLEAHGLHAEILISDNGSTDGSRRMAEGLGCRVSDCTQRGYGSALIHGSEAAYGRYILIGDADASYDFEEGVDLVLKLADGYDLCMGTRMRGRIMPGAMPWKNRYIGNPVLTGVLNLFYRSGLSDAHCGLRAYTKEAFHRLRLESRGMEFASEMVVKAALLKLKCAELPVTLHPDKRERAPHLRPWRDGWRHLKFLLMFSPLWLYFIPAGLLLGASTFVFVALLSTPPGRMFWMGPLWIGDHWLILAGGLFTIGYQALHMGLAALAYTIERKYRPRTPWLNRIYRVTTVEIMLVSGALLLLAGLWIIGTVFVVWSQNRFGSLEKTRQMVVATTLIVAAFQNLFGSFLLGIIHSEAE